MTGTGKVALLWHGDGETVTRRQRPATGWRASSKHWPQLTSMPNRPPTTRHSRRTFASRY